MRFGRITGHVVEHDNTLELNVVLDSGTAIESIRTGRVPKLGDTWLHHDLGWQADQYTQETIGNELALLGWEAVAEEPAAQAPTGTGVSATYLVRKTGGSF